METYERCPRCDVPFRKNEKVLWCRMRGCEETELREPTPQMLKVLFKRKEKE